MEACGHVKTVGYYLC